MQPFLEQVIDQLLAKYGNAVADTCIVIPNRRGALFIRKYIAEKIKQPIFLPAIFSIEDFIFKLSGYKKADQLYLLFELYEVYKNQMGADADSFDEFVKWAQILLSDFNEIDKYLADANAIFGNLSEIKYIENWSLTENNLTEFQQQYLKFYASLGSLYKGLQQKLTAVNIAYDGMAYREVVNTINEKADTIAYSKIIFAGFNALNAAEEKIMMHLYRANKADMYWDADDYYLQDEQQEAGKFLRQWINQFTRSEKDKSEVIKGNLLTGEKNIFIIGTPKNIGQTYLAHDALSALQEKDTSLKSTALVLADESILIPALYALPKNVTAANVTMGYPLKNTPIASLITILFDLHENARKAKSARNDSSLRFYHKDLLRLIRHPYFIAIYGTTIEANQLTEKIIRKNYIYISKHDLEKITDIKPLDSVSFLLTNWNTPLDTLNCLQQITQALTQNKTHTINDLETEFLFTFSKIIKRVSSLVSGYTSISEIKTLRVFIKQMLAAETIPFYGEPLSGLQVMGILETRTLDFENIILLSANENVLPSAKAQSTFIPIDLKKYFGLPIYSDKDALYAYHFYRLIQRAKNIYLIYNTESDEMGKGERSRFIEQLIYELPKKNKQVKITQQIAVPQNQTGKTDEAITVTKTAAISEKIKEKFLSGISPSALNSYILCPLQFYFRHIEKIYEPDNVEEDIGADVLGNAIHDALEKLYKPHEGKIITANEIKKMLEDAELTVEDGFTKYYESSEMKFGKNLLTLKAAVRFTKNFLAAEKNFIEKLNNENKTCTILQTEKELKKTITVDNQTVLLSGKTDRIDLTDNCVRIIDYKTGKVEKKELNKIVMDEIALGPQKGKAFQVMFYAYLFKKAGDASIQNQNIKSGIISLRNIDEFYMAINNHTLSDTDIDEFETALSQLLSEIMNANETFYQTDDVKACEYCSFKTICNK
jgi:CRISPR/Cas system-associated exonuclease Cas4 (RecB family)